MGWAHALHIYPDIYWDEELFDGRSEYPIGRISIGERRACGWAAASTYPPRARGCAVVAGIPQGEQYAQW